jgi:uncharacterized protein (TIGR03086 family)
MRCHRRMRGLSDAAETPADDDDDMDEGQAANTGWADEVQELMVHGRDREAAELAARHLRDPETATSPTRGDTTMGPLEQLAELGPLLGHVTSAIMPEDLDSPTSCANFTVRGVLGHMIGGATQFAAAFRGASPPSASSDVSQGADVVARAQDALAGLVGAVASPGALDRTIASPFGEMPGDAFARFVVLDGLVHGWDIATAIGQTYAPSDALVAEADAFARRAIAPAMRDGDTFAAVVEPPADATPIEQLAAFTGRRI